MGREGEGEGGDEAETEAKDAQGAERNPPHFTTQLRTPLHVFAIIHHQPPVGREPIKLRRALGLRSILVAFAVQPAPDARGQPLAVQLVILCLLRLIPCCIEAICWRARQVIWQHLGLILRFDFSEVGFSDLIFSGDYFLFFFSPI